jgi:hypothetical protein
MKPARGHTTLDYMQIRKNFIAPLLLAAAAAAAIAAAPTAMADTTDAPVFPHDHTTLISPSTGNNQINDASPPVNFAPQYPYYEGGYYGGYHGGYSHGGFGGGFGGGHGGGGHR